MKPITLLLIIVLFVSGCSSTKSTSTASADTQSAVGASSDERDGSSYDKAVVVKSIREEYDWVRNRYPDSKFIMQALSFEKKKPYDILTFKMPDGSERSFYFDISSFFGKGF